MSSGHRGTDAAPVQAVVVLIQKHPGLRAHLNHYPVVSRKFLVPYGAGSSADGQVVYIDEGIPERFKMGVEPDEFVCRHEQMEWWLMTRLNKDYWVGPGAKSAHWWATGWEHMGLKMAGWSDQDIEAYEAEWDTYISNDESQRISPETVPPDIYQGPYDENLDSEAADKAVDKRILPILQAARARMLVVQQARMT